MTTAPLLSRDLLNELEARLRAARAPVAERLQPGLSEAQIDELTTPLGLQLPYEAREWWMWRDGVAVSPGGDASVRTLGRFQLAPLAELVEHCLMVRELYADVEAENPGLELWSEAWFPVLRADTREDVVCDCSIQGRAPTPIQAFDPEFLDEDKKEAPSFGTLVSWWVEALDEGVLRYDPRAGTWRTDRDAHRRLHPERASWFL